MNTLTKLNLNNNPATFLNGDIKYAKNIVATPDQKTIHNEDGFSPVTTYSETIIGKVEIPTGYVLLLKGDVDKIVCVDRGITKTISSTYFNFDINHPIKGRYTFNSNNDLYITFTEGVDSPNETRIINITQSPETLTEDQVKQLDLIPNMIYPSMRFEITTDGSILVGVYQVAISYQVEESIYTNYSILSEPIYIFGNLTDHNRIGTPINRAIKVIFNSIDTSYAKFKIGILYKGEDAFEKYYETDDIDTSVDHYNISNLDSLFAISVENLTVGSISYIKDNDHVSFNGRLIRTNVETINYTGLDDIMNNIASKIPITLLPYTPDNGFNDESYMQVKHFKAGEYYIPYIGCFDYKGNFVNAYPIPWKDGDETELAYANSSNTFGIHKIPYLEDSGTMYKTVCKLNAKLPDDIDSLLGTFVNTITSFCYFYAEHSMINSKIVGQGFAIRDYDKNDFSDNQTYAGSFRSKTKIRFYSFEHLFNKSLISNVYIFNSKALGGLPEHLIYGDGNDFHLYAKGFRDTDTILSDKTRADIESIQFINDDNVVDNNIAGNSYHRITLLSTELDKIFGGVSTHDYTVADRDDLSTSSYSDPSNPAAVPVYNMMAIFDLVSSSDYFYDDIYKQRLVICSNIITKENLNTSPLSGDFFYNNLSLRHTGPATTYVYGTNDLSQQSETNVIKIVTSFSIESRFNIKARYNGVNSYQKVYNFNPLSPFVQTVSGVSNIPIPKIAEFIDIPYVNDNFINTADGKGYSLSCNYNGYDDIIYDKKLDIRYTFFNRVIRSVVNSSESKGITWRIFNAIDYKDIPIERGSGIIIEADERTVYIQQEFALYVAVVRDLLSNTPGNDTFLGTSDLFDRAPLELMYSTNGYIGCDNRFSAIVTPMGYIVVDTVLKNIFIVKSTQIKKLNDPDVEQWFRDNLISGLINPYNKQGISLLYDDIIKSIFLTQQGGDKDFTIHYNFSRNGGWLSFHEYIPEAYISNRFNTFCIKDNTIFKRNANNKCFFFDGKLHSSEVTYIYNIKFEIFKQILGISWDTFIKEGNRIVYDSTIDTVMIYNDTQCTGIIDVNDIINWFDTRSGVYKKDQWYLNDIVDKVVDDKLPFVDDQGNVIGNISNILDWFKESSFISKHIYIKFGINNSAQRDVVLNSYDVNATKSIR